MTRYWVIAPYDSTNSKVWDRVWLYDLTNGVIAIGWRELGDTSACDEKGLKALIDSKYGDKNTGWRTWSFNSMWRFWHEIKAGDVIIARKGTKRIAGIGIVTRTAFYDSSIGYERVGRLTDDYYSNLIGVQWHDSPRDKGFDKPVFSFQAIYEISEARYRALAEEDFSALADTDEEVEEQSEFVLEKYLEEFIVSNFDRIFKGKLVLYRDTEGNIAQQYPTDIGTIDILAEELATNSFVVIELKKGRESDKVIGQTLRYMGWVAENLCKDGQKVRAIIVCKEADSKLLYALRMTNNIEVKGYLLDFRLIDLTV